MSASVLRFISATPILASLDLPRTVAFYRDHLGFAEVYCAPGQYGIVERDGVALHFWACPDRHLAENTSCRIRVEGIAELYARAVAAGIVHPRAPLAEKPWGSREFGLLDPDGNLVTLVEELSPRRNRPDLNCFVAWTPAPPKVGWDDLPRLSVYGSKRQASRCGLG